MLARRRVERGKSIRDLGVRDVVNAGLSVAEAIEFDAVLREILSLCVSFTDIWFQIVTRRVLKPSQPHSLHQLVYYSLYQSSSNAYLQRKGRADDTMNLGGIKTSSVEIERVCDRADECIMETAAISVTPASGGSEQLVIFVVLKKGYSSDVEALKKKFSKAIQSNLNPLFKFNWSEHRPVKVEAAGSSPVSPK
ncbi:hypothetical protein Ahy_B03g068812 isoform F [Arachis hypogaea]|uniref:AMP-binding enzyme C-terminal domain-containing protein n=1 Tax=Arachis hypogaea TaxID=3818 RepID=A0A445AAY9_ARAHY|nr:hypothetical protein Ahy_B03g068812 isoform F [Arachis hypogaea]